MHSSFASSFVSTCATRTIVHTSFFPIKPRDHARGNSILLYNRRVRAQCVEVRCPEEIAVDDLSDCPSTNGEQVCKSKLNISWTCFGVGFKLLHGRISDASCKDCQMLHCIRVSGSCPDCMSAKDWGSGAAESKWRADHSVHTGVDCLMIFRLLRLRDGSSDIAVVADWCVQEWLRSLSGEEVHWGVRSASTWTCEEEDVWRCCWVRAVSAIRVVLSFSVRFSVTLRHSLRTVPCVVAWVVRRQRCEAECEHCRNLVGVDGR